MRQFIEHEFNLQVARAIFTPEVLKSMSFRVVKDHLVAEKPMGGAKIEFIPRDEDLRCFMVAMSYITKGEDGVQEEVVWPRDTWYSTSWSLLATLHLPG